MSRATKDPSTSKTEAARLSPVRRAHAEIARREGRAGAAGVLGLPLDGKGEEKKDAEATSDGRSEGNGGSGQSTDQRQSGGGASARSRNGSSASKKKKAQPEQRDDESRRKSDDDDGGERS